MKVMAQKKPKEPQVERFKEAARVLGCDEDEAAFEAKLKKIASALPPKKQAKKPKHKRYLTFGNLPRLSAVELCGVPEAHSTARFTPAPAWRCALVVYVVRRLCDSLLCGAESRRVRSHAERVRWCLASGECNKRLWHLVDILLLDFDVR
jgi:hypothetical protein